MCVHIPVDVDNNIQIRAKYFVWECNLMISIGRTVPNYHLNCLSVSKSWLRDF